MGKRGAAFQKFPRYQFKIFVKGYVYGAGGRRGAPAEGNREGHMVARLDARGGRDGYKQPLGIDRDRRRRASEAVQ